MLRNRLALVLAPVAGLLVMFVQTAPRILS
jgi:hypothetical protein